MRQILYYSTVGFGRLTTSLADRYSKWVTNFLYDWGATARCWVFQFMKTVCFSVYSGLPLFLSSAIFHFHYTDLVFVFIDLYLSISRLYGYEVVVLKFLVYNGLLLVYKSKIDVCMFILYSVTLINVLVSFRWFLLLL